jgi:hypothetical protein
MIAFGSKLGIDATRKLPGEGFKRPWPPLIKMDAAVKAKVERILRERTWFRSVLIPFPLQAARVTDDAPDQAVIMRMRSRTQSLVQSRVKLVFVRLGRGPIRHLNSQASQPGRGNQNQQGKIAHPALRQIGKAGFDELFPRQ